MHFKNLILKYKSSLLLRILFQTLLLIAVFIAIQVWQSLGVIKGQAPIVFDRALDGSKIDLRRYQEKPVVVYFWADWCPICKYETPVINELAKDYQVFSVATFVENKQAIVEYLQNENIDMSVIIDKDNQWARLYNVNAVPAIFILDGKGNVRFVEKGFTSSVGLRLRLWWVK